jgi:hypothetical protein
VCVGVEVFSAGRGFEPLQLMPLLGNLHTQYVKIENKSKKKKKKQKKKKKKKKKKYRGKN